MPTCNKLQYLPGNQRNALARFRSCCCCWRLEFAQHLYWSLQAKLAPQRTGEGISILFFHLPCSSQLSADLISWMNISQNQRHKLRSYYLLLLLTQPASNNNSFELSHLRIASAFLFALEPTSGRQVYRLQSIRRRLRPAAERSELSECSSEGSFKAAPK